MKDVTIEDDLGTYRILYKGNGKGKRELHVALKKEKVKVSHRPEPVETFVEITWDEVPPSVRLRFHNAQFDRRKVEAV